MGVREGISGGIQLLPVRAYLIRAAVVSMVLGLFVGSMLGVVIVWLAGATIQWMRQLSFTTGVDLELLPFGDRFATLQVLRDRWFLVIPITALGMALLGSFVGILAGTLLAAIDRWLGPPTYILVEPARVVRNRVPRRLSAPPGRSRRAS
jgi:NhaP-type Na+/H+ or K+/H+ antiporter